jgi:hypothetical protein
LKKVWHGFIAAAVSVLVFGMALTALGGEGPGNFPESGRLLPGDDEISGWKRSEKLVRASKDEELYKIINGGAGLYISHGFRSLAGQSYQGLQGWELEVYVFDQGSSQNAENLYADPFNQPGKGKEIAGLGEKARIDESSLFSYGVEFFRKGFFVRVIAQNKTQEGLETAVRFARAIAGRIQ